MVGDVLLVCFFRRDIMWVLKNLAALQIFTGKQYTCSSYSLHSKGPDHMSSFVDMFTWTMCNSSQLVENWTVRGESAFDAKSFFTHLNLHTVELWSHNCEDNEITNEELSLSQPEHNLSGSSSKKKCWLNYKICDGDYILRLVKVPQFLNMFIQYCLSIGKYEQ